MDFSNLKSLIIPEGEVSEITYNGVLLWKSGYTNLVPLSATEDDNTIYNDGLGYKNNYRVRSGGAEGATSVGSCTGFIPVKAGDVVRLSGFDFSIASNENAINVSDSSHTNIGQFTMLGASYGVLLNAYNGKCYSHESVIQEKTGVWKWVVPPDASIVYMRVSGHTLGDGSKMIVTVNEEIEL